MSRRPLAHPVERLAKAQSRMAPGGLLWSESPIPRRYSPRVREAGEEAVPPPPPLTMAIAAGASRYTGNPTSADVTGILSVFVPDDGWHYPPIAGDPVAAVVIAKGPTVTAPAGWTTLATGSLGATCTYRIAAVNSAPAGLSGVWSTPGATSWVSCAWAPTGLPASTSHMPSSYQWALLLGAYTTSGSTGAWPAPTDPAWVCSIPGVACEFGVTIDTGSLFNSVGTPYSGQNELAHLTVLQNPRVTAPAPMPRSAAGTGMGWGDKGARFAVGGLDSLGRVWHPDNTFTWSNSTASGHLPFLLGLK